MMYLHKEGKVAEYAHTKDKFYFDLVGRPSGFFDKTVFDDGSQFQPGWFKSKEEALKAAMDYHEEEGCKLYLELYPAPDKGGWAWIAQNSDGGWCGHTEKPFTRAQAWDTESASYNFLKKSPPNPFWRKTLR